MLARMLAVFVLFVFCVAILVGVAYLCMLIVAAVNQNSLPPQSPPGHDIRCFNGGISYPARVDGNCYAEDALR